MRLLLAYLLVGFFLGVCVAYANGDHAVTGVLEPCESKQTIHHCYRIGANFYLNFDQQHAAIAADLQEMTGREIELTARLRGE